jgi:phage terminase Nu1 subunit (DNA packaging protein)
MSHDGSDIDKEPEVPQVEAAADAPVTKLVTQEQLLEALGISYPTLWRYRKEGLPEVPIGGKQALFHLERCKAWMEEKGYTGKIGRPSGRESEGSKDLKDQLAEAKIQKERLLAERHKLSLDIAKRAVLPVAEVMEGRLQRIAVVKAGLLSLPGKLAQRLAMRSAGEVQVELEREIHQLLAEFAKEKTEDDTTAAGGGTKFLGEK